MDITRDIWPPQGHSRLTESLEKAVHDHVFPGAVLGIGHRGKRTTLLVGKFTYAPDAPRVTSETIYDLASLTKVVATTTMAMILVDRGLLDINRRIAEFLPDFIPPFDLATGPLWTAREEVTVRHLLAHTSGLPGYEQFFLRARKKSHLIEEALALSLEESPGQKAVYSDVGFILLGEILERASKVPLDIFCQREIFAPLGMRSTCFNPPAELLPRIAPTEQDNLFRKRLICGEVHDENAWVMGGIAGHAGLFGTADDLAVFCQMMLDEGNAGGKQLIEAKTVREFTQALPCPQGDAHALGWGRRSEPFSSGKYFSPMSYGHLGYTGTSIWIDPEKQLFVILLTNRVHPTRENDAIRAFRPVIHDAVVETVTNVKS